jgi:hypothetical protein
VRLELRVSRRTALSALTGLLASAIPSYAQDHGEGDEPRGRFHPTVDGPRNEELAELHRKIAAEPALGDLWHTGRPSIESLSLPENISHRVIDANPRIQRAWFGLLSATDRLLAASTRNRAWRLVSDRNRAPGLRAQNGTGLGVNLSDLLYFPQYETQTPFYRIESMHEPANGFWKRTFQLFVDLTVGGGIQFNDKDTLQRAVVEIYGAAAEVRAAAADVDVIVQQEAALATAAWFALARQDVRLARQRQAIRVNEKRIAQLQDAMALGIQDAASPDRIRVERARQDAARLQKELLELQGERRRLELELLRRLTWKAEDDTLSASVRPGLPMIAFGRGLVAALVEMQLPDRLKPDAGAIPARLTWAAPRQAPGFEADPLSPEARGAILDRLWRVSADIDTLVVSMPNPNVDWSLDLNRLAARFTESPILAPSPKAVRFGFLIERLRQHQDLLELDKKPINTWRLTASLGHPLTFLRPEVDLFRPLDTPRTELLQQAFSHEIAALRSDIVADQIDVRAAAITLQRQGETALAKAQLAAEEIVRLIQTVASEANQSAGAFPDVVNPSLQIEERYLDIGDALLEAAEADARLHLLSEGRAPLHEALRAHVAEVTADIELLAPSAPTSPARELAPSAGSRKKRSWIPSFLRGKLPALLPLLDAPSWLSWDWMLPAAIVMTAIGVPYWNRRWAKSRVFSIAWPVAGGAALAWSLAGPIVEASVAGVALALLTRVMIPNAFKSARELSPLYWLHQLGKRVGGALRLVGMTGVLLLVLWSTRWLDQPVERLKQMAIENITAPVPGEGQVGLSPLRMPIIAALPPGESGEITQGPAPATVRAGSNVIAWEGLPPDLIGGLERISLRYPELLPMEQVAASAATPRSWVLVRSLEEPGSVEFRLRDLVSQYDTAVTQWQIEHGLAAGSRSVSPEMSASRPEEFWSGEMHALARWARGLLAEAAQRNVRATSSFTALAEEPLAQPGLRVRGGEDVRLGSFGVRDRVFLDIFISYETAWDISKAIRQSPASVFLRFEMLDTAARPELPNSATLDIPVSDIEHIGLAEPAANPFSGSLLGRPFEEVQLRFTVRWPDSEASPLDGLQALRWHGLYRSAPGGPTAVRGDAFEPHEMIGLAMPNVGRTAAPAPIRSTAMAEPLRQQRQAAAGAVTHFQELEKHLQDDLGAWSFDPGLSARITRLLDATRQKRIEWERRLERIESALTAVTRPGIAPPKNAVAVHHNNRSFVPRNPVAWALYPLEIKFPVADPTLQFDPIAPDSTLVLQAPGRELDDFAYRGAAKFSVTLPDGRTVDATNRSSIAPNAQRFDQLLLELRLPGTLSDLYPGPQVGGLVPVKLNTPEGRPLASLPRGNAARVPSGVSLLAWTSLLGLGALFVPGKSAKRLFLGQSLDTVAPTESIPAEPDPSESPPLRQLPRLAVHEIVPLLGTGRTYGLLDRELSPEFRDWLGSAVLLHALSPEMRPWVERHLGIASDETDPSLSTEEALRARLRTVRYWKAVNGSPLNFARVGDTIYLNVVFMQALWQADQGRVAAAIGLDLLLNPRYQSLDEPSLHRLQAMDDFETGLDALLTPAEWSAVEKAAKTGKKAKLRWTRPRQRSFSERTFGNVTAFLREFALPYEKVSLEEIFGDEGMTPREARRLSRYYDLRTGARTNADRKTTHYLFVNLIALAMALPLVFVSGLFIRLVSRMGLTQPLWATLFRDAHGLVTDFSLRSYFESLATDTGASLAATYFIFTLTLLVVGFLLGQIKPLAEHQTTALFWIRYAFHRYILRTDGLARTYEGQSQDSPRSGPISMDDAISRLRSMKSPRETEGFREDFEALAYAIIEPLVREHRRAGYDRPSSAFRHMATAVAEYARRPLHPGEAFWAGDAMQAPTIRQLDDILQARGVRPSSLPATALADEREKAFVAFMLVEMENHPIPALMALISFNLLGLSEGYESELVHEAIQELIAFRLKTLAPGVSDSYREFSRYHDRLRLFYYVERTLRSNSPVKRQALAEAFEGNGVIPTKSSEGLRRKERKPWSRFKKWKQIPKPRRIDLAFLWSGRLSKNHPQAAEVLLQFLQRGARESHRLPFLDKDFRMQFDDSGSLTTSIADLLTLYIEGSNLLEEVIAVVSPSDPLLAAADLAVDQALLPNLREGVRWTRRFLELTSGDVKVLGVTRESDAFMEQLDVRLQTRRLPLADLQRVKTLMFHDVPRLRRPSRTPLVLSSLSATEWEQLSQLDQAVVTAIPNTFLLPTAVLSLLRGVAPRRLEVLSRSPHEGASAALFNQRLGSLETRIDRHMERLAKAGIKVLVRPHSDDRAKKDFFPPARRDVLGIFLPASTAPAP